MGIFSRWRKREPEPGSLSVELLRQLGRGELGEAGFGLVFELYHPRLVAFFGKRVFRDEDAEDLTQDVLARVYQGRGSFESVADFDAWIFTIAANRARNWQRSRVTAKRDGQAVPVEDLERVPASVAVGAVVSRPRSPLDDFLAQELVDQVHAALRELPARMGETAWLRFVHELPYEEIAARMEVSAQTVKAQLHQARLRLKGELGERVTDRLPPEEEDG
jgi:RNA polymerase sigma-70 factor, ECF subfamily